MHGGNVVPQGIKQMGNDIMWIGRGIQFILPVSDTQKFKLIKSNYFSWVRRNLGAL